MPIFIGFLAVANARRKFSRVDFRILKIASELIRALDICSLQMATGWRIQNIE
jgi:hypothetical protein